MAAPTIRDYAHQRILNAPKLQGSGSTDIVLGVPVGTVAGDRLVAFAGVNTSFAAVPSNGWEVLAAITGPVPGNNAQDVGNAYGQVLTKVSTGDPGQDTLILEMDAPDLLEVDVEAVMIVIEGQADISLVAAARQDGGAAGTRNVSGAMLLDDLELAFWWARGASALPTANRGTTVVQENADSLVMRTTSAPITNPATALSINYPAADGSLYYVVKVQQPGGLAGQEPWNAIALTPDVPTTPRPALDYDSGTDEYVIARGRTIWFKWSTGTTGTGSVTTTPSLPAGADCTISVYTGPDAPDSYDDLTRIGTEDGAGGPATFDWSVLPATYYFQVDSRAGVDDYAVELSYTTTAGAPATVSLVSFAFNAEFYVEAEDPMPPDLILSLHTPELESAPGMLSVSLVDAGSSDLVIFEIDGEEVFSIEPDPDGGLDLASVPVPDLMNGSVHLMQPGTHTLTATQGMGVGTAEFEIINPPPRLPEVLAPDAPPVPIPGSVQPTGVRRWVFQDLMPGGLGSWVLPMNPQEMSSPAFARELSVRSTLSEQGQHHITEDAWTPLEWEFSGVVPTKTMREKLEAFFDLNRRWYLHDHRGRAWKVTFQNLELTPRLTTNWDGMLTNEVHDYSATVLVMEREWVDL